MDDLLHILSAICGRCQKMKDRAIVPDVDRMAFKRELKNIGHNPLNLPTCIAQSTAGRFQCRIGNIKHGQVSEPGLQQTVDERRGSSANVDDRRILRGNLLNQGE